MHITIRCTQIDRTDALVGYAEKKIQGALKYLGTRANDSEVVVELSRTTHHHAKGDVFQAEANVNLPAKQFRIAAHGDDLYATIDELRDTLASAVQRYKEQLADHHTAL